MKRTATLCVLLLAVACGPRDFTSSELAILRTLTDLPDPTDPSNRYASDPRAVELGKALFFDARFSGNSSGKDRDGRSSNVSRTTVATPVDISCASCHDPKLGGADRSSQPNAVSIGAGRFNVNAPSLINTAYWDVWFWNGQLDSLWSVGIVAAEAGVAFNSDRLAVAWRLFDVYREQYEEIFTEDPLPLQRPSVELDEQGRCLGSPPCPAGCIQPANDPTRSECWPRFPAHAKPAAPGSPLDEAYRRMSEQDRMIVNRAVVNFAKAIAAYEMQLVVKSSPFDEYLHGGDTLSDEAIRGAKLFIGKAACIECHRTPLFSDRGFHNTGVPEIAEAHPWESECVAGSEFCDCADPSRKKWCLPHGAADGFSMGRFAHGEFHRNSVFSDTEPHGDRPTREVTDDLRGAWRTASLRNLADTAPYMHNGAYRTLEEVIRHYDQGGTAAGAASEHKSPVLQPLGLTARDVGDLVAFLEALNGDPLPAELTEP
jgi:cytochrome c peroxidase